MDIFFVPSDLQWFVYMAGTWLGLIQYLSALTGIDKQLYEVAEVISTFVYRKGLLEVNYIHSSTVGLLNSVIHCILLVPVNTIINKLTETKRAENRWFIHLADRMANRIEPWDCIPIVTANRPHDT